MGKTEYSCYESASSPYFGLTRTEYLQRLANKHGDFKVSWNWTDEEGEVKFTKQRTVIELTEENQGRLERVMHRQAMPIEIFVEIDDVPMLANIKLLKTVSLAKALSLPYCIYKSRKGFHVSVLDKHRVIGRTKFIRHVGSDSQFMTSKGTWSMEWTQHWKQKSFTIKPLEVSHNYVWTLLGDI